MATEPLKSLREKASRGLTLTLDEVKLFVSSLRKSYTAAEGKMKDTKKLSRDKKPDVSQEQIDFF